MSITLPTGVRKRGNSYQYIINRDGKQFSGSYPTPLEAARAREEHIKFLDSPDASLKRNPNSRKAKKAVVKNITLKEAIDMTYSIRWEGTKAERSTMVNASTLISYFGANRPIGEITTEVVNTYIISLKDNGLSSGTINRKLACLSVILKTVEDSGGITARPVLMRRKEYRGRERFLSEEEERRVIALLEAWDKLDHLDAFITLLDTGMRTGELFKVKVNDINFKQGKHGIITLWKTKNDRPRSIPMTLRVSSIIQKRLSAIQNPDDYLFPYGQWWLRNVWDRMKSNLGLNKDTQFVPHILRHTCASRLIQRGVPLSMIQKWLGHESMQSTMRYSHLCPDALFDLV